MILPASDSAWASLFLVSSTLRSLEATLDLLDAEAEGAEAAEAEALESSPSNSPSQGCCPKRRIELATSIRNICQRT